MRLNSLRARMTVAFASCVALLLLITYYASTRYALHVAQQGADEILHTSARQVIGELGSDSRHVELSELLEEEHDLRSEDIALMVINANGRVVRRSQSNGPSWPRRPQDGWRTLSLPFQGGQMVIGIPWKRTQEALREQEEEMLTQSLIGLILATCGAWFLVGHTLSPIGRLTRQAEDASIRHLNIQLSAPSQDAEIVGLVATLNGLLSRLTETTAARGRFYAAASHELRTPLQALSGHLEVALLRPRTAEQYHMALLEANLQTERLIHLTRDLLLLNQLENASSPSSEALDLTDICETVCRSIQPLMEARSLALEDRLPGEAALYAPRTHLEMLVRNLMENAAKYADEHGQVRLMMQSSSAQLSLQIFNSFQQEGEWNEAKLFEPFYRPDESRNTRTGGNGLGLAICKAIADANGWKLRLEKVPEGIPATLSIKRTSDQ